jgi:hypothetical protein
VKDPTYYCVQVHVRYGGRLIAAPVRWCANARAALAVGRKLAVRHPHVIAYAFEGRPEYGVYGEIRLLARYGDPWADAA